MTTIAAMLPRHEAKGLDYRLISRKGAAILAACNSMPHRFQLKS
jgi:hypothetical protein